MSQMSQHQSMLVKSICDKVKRGCDRRINVVVIIGYILMFLNLKSKRVETALQNHLKAHNHPKTQREERPERTSKEHCERPKKPVPGIMIKKQTASTALTTMQAGSSYSNVAHHYVIQRIDSVEKQSESVGKSIDKLDSHRSQRIANAYRKIKKHDASERIATQQPFEEPPRKSHNRTHYPLSKKEIVNNFANNYIAITEADELDSRRERLTDRQATSYFSKIIELLIQAFRKDGKLKNSVIKFRSLSSKQIDLNESMQRSKRSNKNLKGKSKPLQGTQNTNQSEEGDTFQQMIDRFKQNLMKSEQKSQALRNDQLLQIGVLVKQLFTEIGQFVREIHGKCMNEMEERFEQYEKGLEIVVMEQAHMEEHCKHLEHALAIERNRTSILAQSLQQLHNRTLYCSAFFNQLSFNFDLDSYLRQKLYDFAGENNSFINSHYQSNSSLALKQQFLEGDFGFHKEKRKA